MVMTTVMITAIALAMVMLVLVLMMMMLLLIVLVVLVVHPGGPVAHPDLRGCPRGPCSVDGQHLQSAAGSNGRISRIGRRCHRRLGVGDARLLLCGLLLCRLPPCRLPPCCLPPRCLRRLPHPKDGAPRDRTRKRFWGRGLGLVGAACARL